MERIVQKLIAEERGEELGCDMDKVKGLCKQRARCTLGVAAVRARAVARAARNPLVGCTTRRRPTGCSRAAALQPHPSTKPLGKEAYSC